MTDREGVFTFVNSTFEQVYGDSASEVIGRVTPRTLKSGRVPLEQYTALWNQLISGPTVESAFDNRRRDGRLVDIEARVSPIRDEANTIVGFLAIQRDVTEHRRADATLRDALGPRAGAIWNAAGVILLGRDLDGRITSINRKGCSILGWKESELLGRNWVETCLPARKRRPGQTEVPQSDSAETFQSLRTRFSTGRARNG